MTLALGASAMGSKVKLYATMNGLDLVRKDAGEKIRMPGMPPIDKYVKDALAAGASICACAPSREMLGQMGITESNVIPGVTLEDAIGFLTAALPAAKNGGVVLFV